VANKTLTTHHPSVQSKGPIWNPARRKQLSLACPAELEEEELCFKVSHVVTGVCVVKGGYLTLSETL
jgi:hypothetical protein